MKTYNVDLKKEFQRRFDERYAKCYQNINAADRKTSIERFEIIKAMLSTSKFFDEEKAFIFRPEIFDAFERRFDILPEDDNTFNLYTNFLEKIMLDNDENFFYQQMMKYVDEYIKIKNSDNENVPYIIRKNVRLELFKYDDDLEKYYEDAKKATLKIDYMTFSPVNLSIEHREHNALRKALLDEALLCIYAYSYVNGYDADFSLLNELDLTEFIEQLEMPHKKYRMDDCASVCDFPVKHKFIDYILQKFHEKEKGSAKILTREPKRPHIYK